MTFRERIAIEHPEKLMDSAMGGVFSCPFAYNYEGVPSRGCGILSHEKCKNCWDREAPPRKVKPRRKEHEKADC